MLLRILRYFSGRVSVKVYGGFFETFINICNNENIAMWDISYINNSMYFFTKEKLLPHIAQIAEEAGLEIEIGSYFGLPHIIKNNRKRVALFIGTVVALTFIGVMNTHIWTINVSGNEKMFDSEILEIMEDLGVKVGARKSKINAIDIQTEFLNRTKDRVLWVSLNVEGMCAEIQIREIEEFKDDSTGIPCNYVADFSGIITTYRVYSGTPVVNKGSYVRKGDLLISSVVEYYDQGVNFVESRGLVIARRDKNVVVKNVAHKQIRRYTGIKTQYAIKLFNFEIPLTFIQTDDNDYEITSKVNYLSVNGNTLPFGTVKYTYSFYEKIDSDISEKNYTLLNYISDVEFQTRNSNVINVETKEIKATGVYEISGTIDCLDYLGEKVAINFENNK